MKIAKSIGVTVALAVLAACSSNEQEVYISADVGTLYNAASEALESGQWTRAAGIYNEVERQHPYSEWARRAQLMAA